MAWSVSALNPSPPFMDCWAAWAWVWPLWAGEGRPRGLTGPFGGAGPGDYPLHTAQREEGGLEKVLFQPELPFASMAGVDWSGIGVG